jgi:hypothetical protein
METEDKISIFVTIAPRLEVFFLEEWIEHHLNLGVDQIYIYETGIRINIGPASKVISRELSDEEVGIKWAKKPDADYFLDYTDEQIYVKLNEVVSKYRNNVKLVSWEYKKEYGDTTDIMQSEAYKHCVESNDSDWWINIDPDEYIVLKKHDNLNEYINDNKFMGKHGRKSVGSFWLPQKVFDKRVRTQSVREIFNWGYELPIVHKCIVRPPIMHYMHRGKNLEGTHHAKSTSESRGILKPDSSEIEYFHYRGHPKDANDSIHIDMVDLEELKFDKIDETMKRYLKPSMFHTFLRKLISVVYVGIRKFKKFIRKP